MSAFIDEHRARLGVQPICEVLGVSASAYYHRASGPRSAREVEDERLLELIRVVHKQNYEAYGYRRCWKELLRRGHTGVPRCQVQRLMAENGIRGAKRRGRPWRTTICDPEARERPDLVDRDFSATQPGELLVADFTYVRCWQGTVFFAFVLDVYSRRIVGWQFAGHMRAELVVDALQMAVTKRRPASGTIHSDHGSQFVGLLFGQACHDAGIAQSMGAVGSCYDNAVAETFFATLTKEKLLHDRPSGGWSTRAELRSAIFEYIEGFYNPTRLHSTLEMRSPTEYEADHAAGDPDGLARLSARAGAREKTVHNLRLCTATTTTST